METRSLARLTDHKILLDSVKEFRRDHEDWRSLAAFLMSRNSGRRIRKKNQSRVDKIITNVKAGEVLVKSFLKNRLEGDEHELEKVVNLNAVKKQSDKKPELTESSAKPTLPVDGGGSDMESDLSDEDSDDELNKDVSDDLEISDESEEEVSETQGLKTCSEPKSVQDSSHAKPKTTKPKKQKKLPTEETQGNRHSEMVIKKFNMEDLDSESEILTDTVPSFLVAGSESKTTTQKTKRKDAFFVTSDDSGEEAGDADNEEEEEVESSRLQGGGGQADDSDEENELERGKHAFRSTFMGSLSEKDWRKSNKERNQSNVKNPVASGSSSNFQRNKKSRDLPRKTPRYSTHRFCVNCVSSKLYQVLSELPVGTLEALSLFRSPK